MGQCTGLNTTCIFMTIFYSRRSTQLWIQNYTLYDQSPSPQRRPDFNCSYQCLLQTEDQIKYILHLFSHNEKVAITGSTAKYNHSKIHSKSSCLGSSLVALWSQNGLLSIQTVPHIFPAYLRMKSFFNIAIVSKHFSNNNHLAFISFFKAHFIYFYYFPHLLSK